MHSLYLAIDQGGHASRALLFDEGGTIVRQAEAPIHTLHNDAGHVEHDPVELLASLRRAIDEACTGLPRDSRIAAAGLATQRSSMCGWRRDDGEALTPVISWQDRRNAEWLQKLDVHAARIRELSGLVLTPHYGASKMRWCLDHLPAVRQAADEGNLVMGPLASFILHRLLVERPLLADPANASRTQLWALATRDWSPELGRLFGIDVGLLPKAVTSRYACGTLTTPAGPVPLTVCTGDQSAVPFAPGPLDPACAYVNVGTGGFVQRAVRGRLPDASRLLVSVVWSEDDAVDYMLEGTVNGAGSALDWFARETGADPARLLPRLADAGAAGGIPLFLNGISGLGAPWWVSNFPSSFVGDGDEVAKLAAVVESVAFLLAVNLEELMRDGAPLSRILLTGGWSANDYFCRCLANLSRLPVEIGDDPEATARGLARLLAGDAARMWKTPAGNRLEPRANPRLDERYADWRKAMQKAVDRSMTV